MLTRFKAKGWNRCGRKDAKVVFAIACLLISRMLNAAPPVPDSLRTAVLKRFMSLKNIDAEYQHTIEYTPTKKGLAVFAQMGKKALIGRYDTTCRFSFLDGRARYETTHTAASLKRSIEEDGAKDFTFNVLISSLSRAEIFTSYEGVPPRGVIGAVTDISLPTDSVIDSAIGLRGTVHAGWLNKETLEHATMAMDKDSSDTVVVTVAYADSPLHSWWCRVNGNDAAILKYTYSNADGTVYTQIDCDDFQKAENGISLPLKITANKFYHTKEESTTTETVTIQVQKYTLDGPDNVPARYLMVWPKGSNVTDQRCNETFSVRSGDRTLDDDFINSVVAKKHKGEQTAATQPADGKPN